MSGEKINKQHEAQQYDAESLKQLGESSRERIRNTIEKKEARKDKGAEIQEARKETEAALNKELEGKKEYVGKSEKKIHERGPITRKDKEKSFKKTMSTIQTEMSSPSRNFSKVIHSPVVEKTSEVVGGTVARPNAILSGSITAFLFTLALYLIARFNGYPLSGTETIAAFALGWLCGTAFDALRIIITGKR